MRYLALLTLTLLAACGSSTDVEPTRWNFGIVDGANQKSTAGTPSLAKPITAQLTRDPQGEFAWVDLLLPPKAYAQVINLPGEPVANAIVCGREAKTGEPQVVPLCAFTLADGKAANTVVPGTKAGTYDVVFSAQVPSQQPVVDSTSVVVEPGPANPNYHSSTSAYLQSPAVVDPTAVQDQYGNGVPFRIVPDGRIGVGGIVAGTAEARTVTFDASLYDNAQNHVVELRGSTDQLVGHLRYTVIQGPNGQPQFNWISAGINLAP
jgi:hypothetical protein